MARRQRRAARPDAGRRRTTDLGIPRHRSTTGVWRLARGLAVGAAVSGLGTFAHALAGGGLPPVWLWVGLTLVISAATVFASRWQWRFPALLGALAAGQGVFHAVSRVADGGAPPVMAPMWMGSSMSQAPGAQMHLPLTMLVLHCAAAVLLAGALRLGEGSLRRTADVLGLRLARLVGTGLEGAPMVLHRLSMPGQPLWMASQPVEVLCGRAPPQ